MKIKSYLNVAGVLVIVFSVLALIFPNLIMLLMALLGGAIISLLFFGLAAVLDNQEHIILQNEQISAQLYRSNETLEQLAANKKKGT